MFLNQVVKCRPQLGAMLTISWELIYHCYQHFLVHKCSITKPFAHRLSSPYERGNSSSLIFERSEGVVKLGSQSFVQHRSISSRKTSRRCSRTFVFVPNDRFLFTLVLLLDHNGLIRVMMTGAPKGSELRNG